MATPHREVHDSNNEDLVSHRSSMPSINAANPDDVLILGSELLELKPNNHMLQAEVRVNHFVIMEILKGHPLWPALTESFQVPEIYLQQFWKNLEYHPDPDNFHFTSKVDHFDTSFNITKLRRLLKLPRQQDWPGRTDFDNFVGETQLYKDILALGYSRPLTKIAQFNKKFLPPIYYTLFSIFNRCLTGKNTGIDTASISILTIFHGVVYNRHYNYVGLIWNDLVEFVNDKTSKRNRKYLPFQRFLQRLIKSAMNRNAEIPRRESATLGPVSYMYYLKYPNEDFLLERHLLGDLLSYADQSAPSVIEYIRSNALMVPPVPVGPSQRAIPRGEGLELRDHDQGGHDQGEPRENENERGIGSDGDMTDMTDNIITETVQTETIQEADTAQNEDVQVDEVHSDDDSDEEADEPVQRVRDFSLKACDPTEEEQPNEPEDERQFNEDVMELDDVINMATTGDIRTGEGASVENASESVSARGGKENGENEKRSKDNEDLIQTTESREATFTADEHVLPSSIEQDIVIPAMHCTTPPSHSIVSQQTIVSHTHGDLTHKLSASRSEMVGIEIDRPQPPPSTLFPSRLSLEPIAHDSSSSRTQLMSSTVGSLSGPTGTSVVASMMGVSRGSEGSLAMTTPTPIMNAGTTVTQTAGSMGNLSGSRWCVHPDNLITKALMKEGMKVLHDEYMKQINAQKQMHEDFMNEIRKMVKGKHVMTEPEVVQIPQLPPQPVQTEMTIDELKSMLMARLLSEGENFGSEDVDLIGMLRRQIELQAQAQAQAITKSDLLEFQNSFQSMFQASTKDLQSSIDALAERVSILEETCKLQAVSHKRRHDDHDSDDHHEGKKRLRMAESVGIQTEADTEVEQIQETGEVQGGESVREDETMLKEGEIEGEIPVAVVVDPTVEKPEDASISTEEEVCFGEC